MKAVRFHKFGGADVLRLEEVEDPKPAPGEVSIRIRASALNHIDVDMREGVSGMPIPLPYILGVEVAGDVDEVGPGVDGFARGDRVVPYFMATCGECGYCRTGRESLCAAPGFLGAGYAEKLTCRARQLVRIPDALSYVDAAALPMAFGTSWHMLFTRGKLQAGETVMINSVGSGIGSAAVQLAKLAGAFVIGNASSDEKLEAAKKLGMDVGINRTNEDVVTRVMETTGGSGVDLVYEHVGGELFQTGLDSLKKDGRLVICGAHAGDEVAFGLIPFFRGHKSILGSAGHTKAELETCLELAAQGRIKPVVHATFPLDEAKEAMQVMERREHFGKIVLTRDVRRSSKRR